MGKELVGALRIRVKRGINLANRDIHKSSSDPYVVIQIGDTKVKTDVVKSDSNPVWDEDLTLALSHPFLPIRLFVFDRDTFKWDDAMGDAVIDIEEYVECITRWGKETMEAMEAGTEVKVVEPNNNNCLAEESKVVWNADGKMVQDMILKLNNVECGFVEIQIEWLHLPNSPFFELGCSSGQ